MVSPAHPRPREHQAQPTLRDECGLAWPQPALTSWPPDLHLALAVVLALPVWLAMGLLVGPGMYLPAGWLAWASFALIQPLLEELVFRGVLQGLALRVTMHNGQPRRLGPITLANLMVTLGFVALHLQAQPLVWALAVVVPSLVLGHLRERLASVWPAVLVHAIYNGGFGLTAWLVNH